LDFSTEEIQYLLELSKDFKRLKRAGTPHKYLTGKNIVLLFEKTSTRTRCSFEVAGNDLGMGVTYLDPGSSQMGKKESLEDTAKVLGRMYDGIEYRGFDQQVVEDLARHAGVPVWNGLTTQFHPTQMLADVLTIEENFGRYQGLKMVFMGDARNNVANSLMVVSAKLGINFVACGPAENMPDAELVATCREIAKNNGSTITLTVAQYIDLDLSQDDLHFANPLHQQMFDEAVAHSGEPGWKAETYFCSNSNLQVSQLATALAIDRHQLGGRFAMQPREDSLRLRVQHLVMDFRLDLVEQRLKAIQQQMRQATNDMETTMQLLREHKETKELRDMLAKRLGSDLIV
jgi:hypothetical protein